MIKTTHTNTRCYVLLFDLYVIGKKGKRFYTFFHGLKKRKHTPFNFSRLYSFETIVGKIFPINQIHYRMLPNTGSCVMVHKYEPKHEKSRSSLLCPHLFPIEKGVTTEGVSVSAHPTLS